MSEDQSARAQHTPAERPREQGAAAAATPEALPMPVFLDYLRRLHDGPPQHAAAVRVALAVWQQAVARRDEAQAREAVGMVREELDRLIASLTALQELGRRWSGRSALPREDLIAAGATWEATVGDTAPAESEG